MYAVIPGQAAGLSPEPRTDALAGEGGPFDPIGNGIGSGFRALRSAKPRKDGK